jgi:hypothetical protein
MGSGAKNRYTAIEAASRLGISVEQFRMLVRNHLDLEEDVPENTLFQAADLIVLRVLATRLQQLSAF